MSLFKRLNLRRLSKPKIRKFRFKKIGFFFSFILGIFIVLLANFAAFSEGSQQLGVGSNELNVYLFEYNAQNSFVQPPNARPIKVNVENPGDVINISLCGWSTGDDLAIEVFRPSGIEIDYATQVLSSPGVFSGTAADGNGAWFLTTGNAQTATQTTICTNQNKPNQPTGALTTPVRFVAQESGTYEIRLYNDSRPFNDTNNVLTYFDITVTPDTSTNPNPASTNGQVWSTTWAFNAGNTFTAAGGYNADLYVRVPGGRPNTEFIWQLDLNNFTPQRHEIVANSIGLNFPYSRYSVPGTLNPTYTRDYPIYLSRPNPTSFVAPILPEPATPNLSNLRFIDNVGQDNTISPNTTGAVQDSGFFTFDTDVTGTYEITIDTNKDGVFGLGDRVLFGNVTPGTNAILWDGKGFNNTILPDGTYNVQIMVRIGEYHFVTYDAETSGGGVNNGLSIWKWNSSTQTRSTTTNYWDDASYLSSFPGATTNLVGGDSGTAEGTHTWGNFAEGSIGDTNFMDTWVFGSFQPKLTIAIIGDVDTNDFSDAPDTYGTNKDITVGGTPASHLTSTNIYLGTVAVDTDSDGFPSVDAHGDDVNNTDDEDGVLGFNSLSTTDTTYSVTVRVRNNVAASAYLGGWIDFNRNGTFEPAEGVTQTIANNFNGTVNLNWTGLSGLVAGDTYARFRINNDPLTTSNFIGGGRNGEVEDYLLTIIGPTSTFDYGDAPDTGVVTPAGGNYNTITTKNGPAHLINSSLKLGANAPDVDNGTLQNTNADADDITGTPDDEDGVTLPNTLTTAITSYSATVNVTNNIGTPATLVGWIDFNKNGVFEPTEGTSLTIPDVTNGTDFTLTWTPLSGLTPGNTYARFRLSNGTLTTSTPTGFIGSGEVEDYLVTILDAKPKLLLVKRITAINGSNLTGFDDNISASDPTAPDDNDPNWPSPNTTYLRGKIDGGVVKAGDVLEYTVYFLSKGAVDAKNVTLCDLVPQYTTFLATGFNADTSIPVDTGATGTDLGIAIGLSSSDLPTIPTQRMSNDADGDRGEFFPAGTGTGTTTCSATNDNGAVVVKVVSDPTVLPKTTAPGTPSNSYGFIRFKATFNG